VAFELVWKVAKIRFSDGKPNSAERTGGSRFPKKVWFTLNMDLLDAVCGSDVDYDNVFFSWLGFNLDINAEKEKNLIRFLTAVSESAYFKFGSCIIAKIQSINGFVINQDGKRHR